MTKELLEIVAEIREVLEEAKASLPSSRVMPGGYVDVYELVDHAQATRAHRGDLYDSLVRLAHTIDGVTNAPESSYEVFPLEAGDAPLE